MTHTAPLLHLAPGSGWVGGGRFGGGGGQNPRRKNPGPGRRGGWGWRWWATEQPSHTDTTQQCGPDRGSWAPAGPSHEPHCSATALDDGTAIQMEHALEQQYRWNMGNALDDVLYRKCTGTRAHTVLHPMSHQPRGRLRFKNRLPPPRRRSNNRCMCGAHFRLSVQCLRRTQDTRHRHTLTRS